MIEHGYSGGRAYCQSKLAQIMFTFDLADERRDRHLPASLDVMPTKMVPLADQLDGQQRRGDDAAADSTAAEVAGRNFNVLREAGPNRRPMTRERARTCARSPRS